MNILEYSAGAVAPKGPELSNDVRILLERAEMALAKAENIRARIFGQTPEQQANLAGGVDNSIESVVMAAARVLSGVNDILANVEARLG